MPLDGALDPAGHGMLPETNRVELLSHGIRTLLEKPMEKQ